MATLDLIEAGTDEAPRRLRNPLVDHPPSSELAFPGCKPIHLPREELETWDGRLEFWDGATETAWVCEPNSPCHETIHVLEGGAYRVSPEGHVFPGWSSMAEHPSSAGLAADG